MNKSKYGYCSRCHAIGDKNGKKRPQLFRRATAESFAAGGCQRCGLEHIDSDLNAALNIAALGLSVSQLKIPGIVCNVLWGKCLSFP